MNPEEESKTIPMPDENQTTENQTTQSAQCSDSSVNQYQPNQSYTPYQQNNGYAQNQQFAQNQQYQQNNAFTQNQQFAQNQQYQQNNAYAQNQQYQQGDGYPQNPYYVNPAQTGMPNGNVPKKSKKPLFIVLAIIAVLAVAAAVIFYVFGNKDSKEDTVTTAIQKTFTEQSDSAMAKYIGMENINSMIQDGAFQQSFSLNIDNLDGYSMPSEASYFEGIGIKGDMALDVDKAKYEGTGSLTYGGIAVIDYTVYAYEDCIAISCPALFEGYLEINTTHLGEDFNNSYLAGLLGTTIDSTLAFNYFDLFKADPASGEVPVEIQDAISSIKFASSDKSATITIGNKDQTCKGYDVTMPAETINDLFDYFVAAAAETGVDTGSYEELRSSLPDEDITFTIYTDNKGRMARLSYQNTFEADGSSADLNAEIDFTGVQNALDQITGQITLTMDGESVILNINSNTTNEGNSSSTTATVDVGMSGYTMGSLTYSSDFDGDTGAYNMSVNVSSSGYTVASISLDSMISDVQKGKSFTLDINSMDINLADEFIVGLSGSISLAPLTDVIEVPSGTEHNVFAMTESDWQSFVNEMSETIMSGPLYSVLEQMLGY